MNIFELHKVIENDFLVLTQLKNDTHWRKVQLAELTRLIQNRIHTVTCSFRQIAKM